MECEAYIVFGKKKTKTYIKLFVEMNRIQIFKIWLEPNVADISRWPELGLDIMMAVPLLCMLMMCNLCIICSVLMSVN